jgi:multicomponent Na+:H+ antiporter subunit B
VRQIVFAVGLAGIVILLLVAFAGLPAVGAFAGEYGRTIARASLPERHTPDAVTAVNFDYRGFDTIGEEFILFASVAGVALILRPNRRQVLTPEQRDAVEHLPGREPTPTSNAVRLLALATIGVDVVFGIDIVTHGQLTPGGGFQGGVILASAPILAYLGGDAPTLKRIAPLPMMELAEAAGAVAFVLIGAGGWLLGGAFLQNVVPLGPAEPTLASGGTIPVISLATGLEVAGGFVLLLLTFLEETLQRRGGEET